MIVCSDSDKSLKKSEAEVKSDQTIPFGQDNKSLKDENVNNCNLCGNLFSKKFNLEVHNKKQKHTCEFCQLLFCTKSALLSHRKTIHDKNAFICSSCSYEFTSKYALCRHI